MPRTLLLLLPAVALAAPPELHADRPPYSNWCGKASEKKIAKGLARYQPLLGTDDTRDAWKSLADLGVPGCQAVADWLAAGADGGETGDVRDAGARMILSGTPSQIAVGVDVMLADSDDRIGTYGAALAAKRLVLLDDERMHASVTLLLSPAGRTDPLSFNNASGPANLTGVWDGINVLVGLGLGTYTIVQTPYSSTSYIPGATVQVDVRQAVLSCSSSRTAPPDAAGIRAVERALTLDSHNTPLRLAQNLTCRGRDKGDGADAFVGELRTWATQPDQDKKLAEYSARALGATQPQGALAAAEALIATGHEGVQDNFLIGLGMRIDGGWGNDGTRALAALFAESGHRDVRSRARDCLKDLGE